MTRLPSIVAAVLLVLLQALSGHSWVLSNNARGRAPSWSTLTTQQNMVSSVSVQSIYDETANNPQIFAQEMADSIARWLDAEWMPQEIHQAIGNSCRNSYLSCQQEGDADLMSIMVKVADDLTEDWDKLYDKDAFVNAYDIANYVSDYLTKKSGSEGCACSNKIY